MKYLAGYPESLQTQVQQLLAKGSLGDTLAMLGGSSTIGAHAHALSLGADPSRLAVGGDSAGGTLAAMCAVLARDAGLTLALQLLIYPGCAAHQDTRSHERFAQGFVLDEASISWFFDLYVRSPADREDWRFAPLNAPDVDGVAAAGTIDNS